MIDHTILARQVAAVRDAADRVGEVLPATPVEFFADRTIRETVTLNLFNAVQESLSLATHRLAVHAWEVLATYAGVFRVLGEHNVLDPELSARMAAAAGLRNLIAHRYAALDRSLVHDAALNHVDDLLRFCDVPAKAAVVEIDKS